MQVQHSLAWHRNRVVMQNPTVANGDDKVRVASAQGFEACGRIGRRQLLCTCENVAAATVIAKVVTQIGVDRRELSERFGNRSLWGKYSGVECYVVVVRASRDQSIERVQACQVSMAKQNNVQEITLPAGLSRPIRRPAVPESTPADGMTGRSDKGSAPQSSFRL